MRRVFRLHGRERGQVLVLTALLFVVLMGMSGLATDVGLVMKTRRDLQNAADAAALAAVQQLPGCGNSTKAMAAAQNWATTHYSDLVEGVTASVYTAWTQCDTVHVEVEAKSNLTFMRVLGISSVDVGAEADARIGSVETTREFLPWVLSQENSTCLKSNGTQPDYGKVCSLKVGAFGGVSGMRGALDVDRDGGGGGGSAYRDNIVDSQSKYFYDVGDYIPPLAGNKVGPTGQGLAERLTREPSSYDGVACDTNGNGKDDFDEVFYDRYAGGATSGTRYEVRYGCQDSPRIGIIPIVDHIDTSIIVGWAMMYIIDYACVDGNCNGNGHWEVTGQMVDAVLDKYDALMGAYKPGQPVRWFLVK